MKRITACLLLVAQCGCAVPASWEPSVMDAPSLEEQVADHERRIAALEGSAPVPVPDPAIREDWRPLSHDAGVGLAHIRAEICQEASQRDWKTFEEFSQWASAQIAAREQSLYAPYKTALAREFPAGMESAKFREILRQQAEGYRSVQ